MWLIIQSSCLFCCSKCSPLGQWELCPCVPCVFLSCCWGFLGASVYLDPIGSHSFPTPAPEPAMAPRSPSSFNWRMGFKSQDLGAKCAHCYWNVTVCGPLAGQPGKVLYINKFPLTSMFVSLALPGHTSAAICTPSLRNSLRLPSGFLVTAVSKGRNQLVICAVFASLRLLSLEYSFRIANWPPLRDSKQGTVCVCSSGFTSQHLLRTQFHQVFMALFPESS